MEPKTWNDPNELINHKSYLNGFRDHSQFHFPLSTDMDVYAKFFYLARKNVYSINKLEKWSYQLVLCSTFFSD